MIIAERMLVLLHIVLLAACTWARSKQIFEAEPIISHKCNCTQDEVCESFRCQPVACFDRQWSPSANETDVDCGGGICVKRCGLSSTCISDSDCLSTVCSPRVHRCLPQECADGHLSGNETAIDCGGPQCDPCDDGEDCEQGSDCLSGICEKDDRFICLSKSCPKDTCGSSPWCPRCPVGSPCEHDGQCKSDHCESGACYLSTCESESCYLSSKRLMH